MRQSWSQLVMAHWPVAPATMRRVVPPAFELDLYDGQAWLSVVPFMTTRVRLRGLPPLPGLREFPEVNVRTYVRRGGHAGVYFLRIHATNPVVVEAARRLAGVEYRHAAITVAGGPAACRYETTQAGDGGPTWTALAERHGDLRQPPPGTLDRFLTDRYAAFALHLGRPLRVPIEHPPWQVAGAAVAVERDTLCPSVGVPVVGSPAVAHWAAGQDRVLIGAPRSARR
ncbi:MAG: uncharacterized protein QOG49_825 [Frankiaceae bacterium]|nr:uncharacterized protein [Frankiaceae bacterium]